MDAPDGNVRLLAPAGCGKTRSLLMRCAAVARRAKVGKPRFLVISFTRAAQQELATRLSEAPQFAPHRDQIEVTTLNSWGYRRVRTAARHPKLLTSKEDFHFAVKNALQPVWMKYDEVRRSIEARPNNRPREIFNLIDRFKTLGFDHTRDLRPESFNARLKALRDQGLAPMLEATIDDLVRLEILTSTVTRSGSELVSGGDTAVYRSFFRFWRDAVSHLHAQAMFTLEDQKYFAFLDEQDKLKNGRPLQGAARYDHIFVDEFQDINPLDLALIRSIVQRNRATLTIVGDDDQAIFEWRGAAPEYILNPQRYFGVQFQTFILEINYRSPANIVEHAQRLIAHNSRREVKRTRAFRADKAEISTVRVADLSAAMDRVLKEIERCINEGLSPSRLAVIGRKRSQLIPYQILFASRDLPFCAAEDLQVFLSSAFRRLIQLVEIKTRSGRQSRSQVIDDVLALCSLVKRYPLSKSDSGALRQFLSQSPSMKSVSDAMQYLRRYHGSLKGNNRDGSMSNTMADTIESFLDAETVSDTLIVLGDSFEGLQRDMGKAEDDIFFTDPPFFHLADYALKYDDDYETFLDDVERAQSQLAHLPPFEDGDSATENLWNRPIHLMTAIRSKGKEFDSVILLDVNDGIWPSKNARTPNEREAERRTFYVAFTRARRRISLLVARRIGNSAAHASPFLSELGL